MSANPIYRNSFHGFCIYDVAQGRYIASYNHEKYFTPASNTKLFTFYTGLKLLPEILPALYYQETADSLIFWGSGDPSFLHPDMDNRIVVDFLQKSTKVLCFSGANFNDSRFGSGWAWSDYQYSYSPEKSALPMYSNLLRLAVQPGSKDPESKVTAYPAAFQEQFTYDGLLTSGVERAQTTNAFKVNPLRMEPEEYVPFVSSDTLTARLLSNLIGKPVYAVHRPMPARELLSELPGLAATDVYRQLLHPSDNFVAEQLLLMASLYLSQEESGQMNARQSIEHILSTHLNSLSDKPRWVDGSGLSRYNLFTPRTMVEVLLKIHTEMKQKPGGEAQLWDLLPTAGKTGTLKNVQVYPPTVHAKTGTLSNNHCLSGFLITKSGRLLCFSIMNNHYMLPVAQIREEMGKVLYNYYLHY
jgi:D-alanyl-D-alanine carboxypeptidase/D-alanyl-D-alanine-endopeptidase (penicillin-binding protein 4)